MTTLKNQIYSYLIKGKILDSDGEESSCFNFYDWFCNEKSLKRKAENILPKAVSFIKNHPEINEETSYIFFKNNCPMNGSLYDDFRICDTAGVIFTVTPKCGHASKINVSEIWGRENNFKQPLYSGTWEGLLNWRSNKISLLIK